VNSIITVLSPHFQRISLSAVIFYGIRASGGARKSRQPGYFQFSPGPKAAHRVHTQARRAETWVSKAYKRCLSGVFGGWCRIRKRCQFSSAVIGRNPGDQEILFILCTQIVTVHQSYEGHSSYRIWHGMFNLPLTVYRTRNWEPRGL